MDITNKVQTLNKVANLSLYAKAFENGMYPSLHHPATPLQAMVMYLPNPLHQKYDMTQSQFFNQSTAGLNSGFSFSETDCSTKTQDPSCCYE